MGPLDGSCWKSPWGPAALRLQLLNPHQDLDPKPQCLAGPEEKQAGRRQQQLHLIYRDDLRYPGSLCPGTTGWVVFCPSYGAFRDPITHLPAGVPYPEAGHVSSSCAHSVQNVGVLHCCSLGPWLSFLPAPSSPCVSPALSSGPPGLSASVVQHYHSIIL